MMHFALMVAFTGFFRSRTDAHPFVPCGLMKYFKASRRKTCIGLPFGSICLQRNATPSAHRKAQAFGNVLPVHMSHSPEIKGCKKYAGIKQIR
jgi:hypothetical protein